MQRTIKTSNEELKDDEHKDEGMDIDEINNIKNKWSQLIYLVAGE